MNLRNLLRALPEKSVQGEKDREIFGVAYDSREVGPGYLFVAIDGQKLDGHRYVDQAIARGANAVVVQREVSIQGTRVMVPDSRKALALLSAQWFDHPSTKLRTIGITGTNGKTTTSYLLKSIHEQAKRKVGLVGTIAYYIDETWIPGGLTTPESLDLQGWLRRMVDANTEVAIMEVSSHALVLNRVLCVDFDVAVFTNLSRDHLDFHQTEEEYLRAKGILFEGLDPNRSTAVINVDDDASGDIAKRTRAPIVTFGFDEEADIRPVRVRQSLSGSIIELATLHGSLSLQTPLLGRSNVYNVLAAVAVSQVEDLGPEAIRGGVERVNQVPGRLEMVDEGQDFAVVVDYAHTPDALRQLLLTMRQLSSNRLILVFGCGGDRDRGKRPLMGALAATLADYTIVTSDNPRTEEPTSIIEQIADGMKEGEWEIVVHRGDAIKSAIGMAKPGDVVVIAGKGHEDYQIVGTERVHFDDREVAREVLRNLRSRSR